METVIGEILKGVAAQGPLVGLLLYLLIQNEKKIDKKDDRINALNDALVAIQKETITAIANNSNQAQRLADVIDDLGKK